MFKYTYSPTHLKQKVTIDVVCIQIFVHNKHIYISICIHQLEVVAKNNKENINTGTIAASSMPLHYQSLTLFTTQLAPR